MLPQRKEIANVVVCEDDTPTLELLCEHLVADRYGVLPAPSAADALRLGWGAEERGQSALGVTPARPGSGLQPIPR